MEWPFYEIICVLIPKVFGTNKSQSLALLDNLDVLLASAGQ